MKVETKYTITINEAEKIALKKLLGGLNDSEKLKIGLTDGEMRITSEMFAMLPYGNEE